MNFVGEAFTKDTWFNSPKQVAVMISGDQEADTSIGIAYRDKVICLCCGFVFSREELAEEGAVYKILSWHDLDFQVRKLSDPFKERGNSNS